MTQRQLSGARAIALALAAGSWLLADPAQAATSGLVWRAAERQVDADIQDWSLDTLLKEVAAQTGWSVFVEPNTTLTVSTRFRALPPADALRRLLDRLNFALLPQSNGPPHLLVFRTSMQEATMAVPGRQTNAVATAATPLPNELIVRVKPGTDAEALAKALGAQVIGRLDGLNAYRLRFNDTGDTESARRTLGTNPEVTAVDNNYAIERPPDARDVLSTSVAPLQLRARTDRQDGRVVIGLIDTAVQTLDGGLNDFVLPTVRVADEAKPPADVPSHGTAMAETVLRGLQAGTDGASAARILPVDVYGSRPHTTTFDVAAGVYRAVQEGGATILNLSLGSEGDSSFLHEMLQAASSQGVLIFAAAGNAPVSTPTYPAAYPEVVAVTAGDRTGQIAGYANRGDFVDLVAPGASIFYFNGQPFYVSGTSAATALASGLAAAIAERTRKSPDDVLAELKKLLATRPAP